MKQTIAEVRYDGTVYGKIENVNGELVLDLTAIPVNFQGRMQVKVIAVPKGKSSIWSDFTDSP